MGKRSKNSVNLVDQNEQADALIVKLNRIESQMRAIAALRCSEDFPSLDELDELAQRVGYISESFEYAGEAFQSLPFCEGDLDELLVRASSLVCCLQQADEAWQNLSFCATDLESLGDTARAAAEQFEETDYL